MAESNGHNGRPYHGRLELTWTNKDRALLAREDGTYEWVPRTDYRVAEVRLLHDGETVGVVEPKQRRVRDNLLIQGDALYALHSLASIPEFAAEYAGKVKLAYLDPPFNTQQSFLHYDDGLGHSVWLTMMRDRLLQIRRLLAPDGSVWVHVDDTEAARLRIVMDELFGEECFVTTVIWRSTDNSNNDAKQFSQDHNVILVYAMDPEWRSNGLPRTAEQSSHYKNPDNDPRGPYFDGNPVGSPNPRENLRYTVASPQGHEIPPPPNGWRWSRETMQAKMATGEIRFSDDGKRIIRRTYLADQPPLPPSSLWADNEETGSNRQAKYELKALFKLPTAELFDTPKPERLLRRIIHLATKPGDVVLDCFVGSGTSAAVAHKMGRRWVGIEMSEATLAQFCRPRLERVVAGDDPGGVTELEGWQGGGGFRTLTVGPSMFEETGGMVFLAEWATNGALSQAAAAQLGFRYTMEPPFAGIKGRERLAVIDGLINEPVLLLLLQSLAEDNTLVVCGTAVDPTIPSELKQRRPGSRVRKIPASLLAEYQRAARPKTEHAEAG